MSLYVPISLFAWLCIILISLMLLSFILKEIPAIITSFIGAFLSAYNSQIVINGQLIENIGGVAADGTIVQAVTIIQVPALAYIFMFVGLILIGLTIYHISQEIQYRKDNNYTEVEF